MMQWKPIAAIATIAVAAVTTLGCEPMPPAGSTGSRIDPRRSTHSDRASIQASIPALLEFSDQTAQALALQLTDIPEVRQAPHRLVLELGDLNNKTNTSTSDFEQIQVRLRGRLTGSRHVANHFRIVESRQRMNRELKRVLGEGQARGEGTALYPPEETYVLQGDFYESVRGNRRQYYFEFKLTNLVSRDIVFLESFELGQVTVH